MSWERKQVNKREPVARAERPVEPSRGGRTFVAIGFVLLLIIGGLAAFIKSPRFLITNITVSGVRSLEAESVIEVARQGIRGAALGIVPRSHIFFLSKRAWQRAILEELPAAERIIVSFDGMTANVDVTEREPQYVWCPTDTTDTRCAFLDDTGLRFEIAPRYSRGVFLVFFGGEIVPLSESVRSRLFNREQFTRVMETVQVLRDQQIAIDQVTFEGEDVAYGFQAAHGALIPAGAVIRATRATVPSDIGSRAMLVWQEAGFARSFQANPEMLRVIDVRFPGSIAYRFGEQEVPPPAVETPTP